MTVTAVLQTLGSTRVIWIDDCFNESPTELAKLLSDSFEVTQACGFPELTQAIEEAAFDPAATVGKFAQALTDLPPTRRKEMRAAFFEREGKAAHFATKDMSDAEVAKTCALLEVAPADRWTFDKAGRHLQAICAAGDETISYVVDLNESGGSATRGLEVLKDLHGYNSKGTAFILTHDTEAQNESKKESELRLKLKQDGIDVFNIPVCVVAKERFKDDGSAPDAIETALKIGIKRAGLRRSLHEVLAAAKAEASKSIEGAAEGLLSVPPEHLEKYVYERGYKEGVSELHVVERAITAHYSRHLRTFFGTSAAVQKSAKRFRGLRHIDLKTADGAPDPHLVDFREAELWEASDLINQSLTPIACGDVFELDVSENLPKGMTKKYYLLLGQPCDISLRPQEKRQQDAALFIPLKKKETNAKKNLKEEALPFRIDGVNWVLDFRAASNVSLAVLDLASFRTDGRVRVDDGHTAAAELLVAQQDVYAQRTAPADAALLAAKPILDANDVVHIGLQLTFGSRDTFKHVQCATFEPATPRAGERDAMPKRVTWKLRRCGRLRMPYAAAMLDKYLSVMNRDAFDLDYLGHGAGESA